MDAYAYRVTEEVLVIFSQAKSREREELLRAFSKLSADPFRVSPSSFRTESGHECQVHRAGRWMVVYWVEHVGRRVHILSVERLRA